MTSTVNNSSYNRLWMHNKGERVYLSTVTVKMVLWDVDSNSATVTLEGLLYGDEFLLDIHKDRPNFEIRSGICGDPKDYANGDTLMWIKYTSQFTCRTENVVTGREEAEVTRLYCQFRCKEATICDS